MSRLKIVVVAIVAVLAVIVILQNTDAVSTRVLFATVTMSQAILLLLVLVAGFFLGMATPGLLAGIRKTGS